MNFTQYKWTKYFQFVYRAKMIKLKLISLEIQLLFYFNPRTKYIISQYLFIKSIFHKCWFEKHTTTRNLKFSATAYFETSTIHSNFASQHIAENASFDTMALEIRVNIVYEYANMNFWTRSGKATDYPPACR